MIEKIGLKEIVDHAQQLIRMGAYNQAIHVITQVIGQHPENPYLNYVMATAMMHKGNFGTAMVLLLQAVRTKKNFAEAWNNLAICYRREYLIEESRNACKSAIRFKEFADPYNNLASTYINEGCPEEGLKWSDRALALQKPDTEEYHKTQWNRSLMKLEMGELREGFDLYHHGIKCGERQRRNYSEDQNNPTPYLTRIGKLKPEHTIVVYGEQGMGDEIMFLSCLQNVIETGATVILECHPRMTSLFQRAFPNLEIHGTRKRDDITWPLDRQIDYCVAVGSLPALYLQTHESFHKRAYIKAEENVARDMREQLGDDRPIIGIAWSGGTKKTNNLYRTLPYEALQLITDNPQFKFVSLEYDNQYGVPPNVEPTWEICQHYNYDLTAALVDACDAVICINTSVVHLAGAMGKRVFCLTPSKPAWRYGLKGTDMMFYPDVHQYRQTGEDWKPAIIQLMKDLDIWANLHQPQKRVASA